MTSPRSHRVRTHKDVAAAAEVKAAQAVRELVDELGSRTAARLRSASRSLPGTNTVQPEPIADLEAAQALEEAAQELVAAYFRLCREAGRSWHEIGDALVLLPRAAMNKVSTAEEVYDYALRYHRGPRPARVT
jgi:hypothetical protein